MKERRRLRTRTPICEHAQHRAAVSAFLPVNNTPPGTASRLGVCCEKVSSRIRVERAGASRPPSTEESRPERFFLGSAPKPPRAALSHPPDLASKACGTAGNPGGAPVTERSVACTSYKLQVFHLFFHRKAAHTAQTPQAPAENRYALDPVTAVWAVAVRVGGYCNV